MQVAHRRVRARSPARRQGEGRRRMWTWLSDRIRLQCCLRVQGWKNSASSSWSPDSQPPQQAGAFVGGGRVVEQAEESAPRTGTFEEPCSDESMRLEANLHMDSALRRRV